MMTRGQLIGMRETAETMYSVVSKTMTAKEMALTAHSLSRSGDMATMADGRVYVWDKRFSQWSMWKGASR